jgi:hypothetical protein
MTRQLTGQPTERRKPILSIELKQFKMEKEQRIPTLSEVNQSKKMQGEY